MKVAILFPCGKAIMGIFDEGTIVQDQDLFMDCILRVLCRDGKEDFPNFTIKKTGPLIKNGKVVEADYTFIAKDSPNESDKHWVQHLYEAVGLPVQYEYRPSLECFKRVDGLIVRWVVKPNAKAYKVIPASCEQHRIKGCQPHNGFYTLDSDGFLSYDVSHIDVDELR